MTAVPLASPLTIPDTAPTVAIEELLLLHSPPGGVSPRIVVPPVHMDGTPVMGAAALTVTTVVAAHPPGVP